MAYTTLEEQGIGPIQVGSSLGTAEKILDYSGSALRGVLAQIRVNGRYGNPAGTITAIFSWGTDSNPGEYGGPKLTFDARSTGQITWPEPGLKSPAAGKSLFVRLVTSATTGTTNVDVAVNGPA